MRHPRDISRRQFLNRAGGAAIAVPSLAAILAACSKPGTPSGGGADLSNIPIATLDAPTELPLVGEPIAADTPIESGPLVLYNWADYIYKKTVGDFEDEFKVNVEISTLTTSRRASRRSSTARSPPMSSCRPPGTCVVSCLRACSNPCSTI